MWKHATMLVSMAVLAGAATAGESPPYTVIDGDRVDATTMTGYRTWQAAGCGRCHGPNQEGLVGPSLIHSLRVLSRERFIETVTEGRLEKGMVSFKQNPVVMQHLDALYAYLKGRADGAITRAEVRPIEPR